jgi:hypothetical protein
VADQHGFRITGSRVELVGYCSACQARVPDGTRKETLG